MPEKLDIIRIAAFADGERGGNPAGVVIADDMPEEDIMRETAARVGFSETAFAAPLGHGLWRVRYFSPESEVPFCGHATIALGAALAERMGDGVFRLKINAGEIPVEGRASGGAMAAALLSPPTRSRALDEATATALRDLFGIGPDQIDPRIPPAHIHAGADHFVLALTDRATLAAMHYDLDAGRTFMRARDLVTIMLVHVRDEGKFDARNAFASGGVFEDPATGAAAAAFAGYLRDLDWPHGGRIEIFQGDDMGMPSRIAAEIGSAPGAPIRVSGTARRMD